MWYTYDETFKKNPVKWEIKKNWGKSIKFLEILGGSVDQGSKNRILDPRTSDVTDQGEIPGGVLDISLGGEVRRGSSYPDPV